MIRAWQHYPPVNTKNFAKTPPAKLDFSRRASIPILYFPPPSYYIQSQTYQVDISKIINVKT